MVTFVKKCYRPCFRSCFRLYFRSCFRPCFRRCFRYRFKSCSGFVPDFVLDLASDLASLLASDPGQVWRGLESLQAAGEVWRRVNAARLGCRGFLGLKVLFLFLLLSPGLQRAMQPPPPVQSSALPSFSLPPPP